MKYFLQLPDKRYAKQTPDGNVEWVSSKAAASVFLSEEAALRFLSDNSTGLMNAARLVKSWN